MVTRIHSGYRDFGIATKLCIGAVIAVLASYAVVGSVLSWRTHEALTGEALETLSIEASMTVDMLSNFSHQIEQEVRSMEASLEGYFRGDFTLDPARPLTVGGATVPSLTVGGRVLAPGNPELERFSQLTKGLATVFVRRGDEFVRVATTVENAAGQRAVGTVMEKSSPAYAALSAGQPYSGKVLLFGRHVYAHYAPIRDAAGRVVGVFFVGRDFTDALAELKNHIKSVKVGKTGYIYALDATAGPAAGTLTIHPAKEGQNIIAARDADGHEFIREMVEKKQGVIHYPWMNAELKDASARMKVVVYAHFKEWNWVVGVGSYSDEFASTAVQVRYYIVVASLCAAAALAWLLVVLSRRMVSEPIARAVDTAKAIAKGDLDSPIEIRSKDEVGELLGAMSTMRDRLREFVGAQDRLVHLHNTEGQLSARLDPMAFPGAYGQIATRTNALIDEHLKVQQRMVDTMQSFARGEFDVDIDPLPGEKARLNDVVAQIRDTLQAARTRADFDQQVRTALDCVAANVRIADGDGKIIYVNEAMRKTLQASEGELARKVPGFRATEIEGQSVGIFYEKPHEGLARLKALRGTVTSRMTIGGRIYDVITTSIQDENGNMVGSVGQWQDLTAQLRAEDEVDRIVKAASAGDLTGRIALEDKSGFIKQVSVGINQLVDTTSTGLEEIARVLSSISSGDLTDRITKQFEGVFGRLKDDANRTCERLTQIVGQIKHSSEAIDVASREIAEGNTDLSSRTEQQSSSLQETASSMEQLTSTVKQNAENARQANQLAIGASGVAVKGGAVVHQVVTTMESITDSSRRIQDIISVIDGIAFQTNILALNAAVEAARAGEQGRGFAVVASEVRSLAQRSAAAAKEIKGLISDSVEKVNVGSKLVNDAGRTMEEIVASVKRVTDIMGEITAASQEQASGIEQVNQAITSMDEVTQQNSSLVERAAAAAQSLHTQADTLSQATALFIIDREHGSTADTGDTRMRLAAA